MLQGHVHHVSMELPATCATLLAAIPMSSPDLLSCGSKTSVLAMLTAVGAHGITSHLRQLLA